MDGQNFNIFKTLKFVNGIGYTTIKNDKNNKIGTIYPLLQLNSDFLDQIQLSVFVKKSFLNSNHWEG